METVEKLQEFLIAQGYKDFVISLTRECVPVTDGTGSVCDFDISKLPIITIKFE